MKIKDIVQEGFLDTLGRGIARGLGAETNPRERNKELQQQADLQMRSKLPGLANDQFKKLLANSGINLANVGTYNYDTLASQIKDYAKYYFVSNIPDPMASYIIRQIDSLSMPSALTDASIAQYFNSVNDIRSNALDRGNQLTTLKQPPQQTQQTQNTQQTQPIQQTQQQPEPESGFSVGGQKLDPNNPVDAKIISAIKKQNQAQQPQADTITAQTPQSPEEIRKAKQKAAQQVIDKKNRP